MRRGGKEINRGLQEKKDMWNDRSRFVCLM